MGAMGNGDIEELSFEGIARGASDSQRVRAIRPSSHGGKPQSNRKRRAAVILGIVAMLAAISGGIGWMWEHHWRPITITANGQAYSVRVDTLISDLLADHRQFGAKPGRLLAVDGSVLKPRGGKPVTVQVNGHAVNARDFDSTMLNARDAVHVSSGKDITEAHEVITENVPHSTSIDITGATIQIKRSDGKDGTRETWVGKQSKKKVDKGIVEKPVDMVVEGISPRPTSAKAIALTFDDGPSQYSDAILDILKQKGAVATFFDVGNQAANYPNVEKRMYQEGHQVASHSNTHAQLTTLPKQALRDELTAGLSSIANASGVNTKVLRAPYGDFSAQQWKDAGDLISMNVLWDIDTLDWKQPGAEAIRNAVLDNAHNGAIVLMHDGGGDRSQDIAALPGIIDGLKAQGYRLVTVQQLIDLK